MFWKGSLEGGNTTGPEFRSEWALGDAARIGVQAPPGVLEVYMHNYPEPCRILNPTSHIKDERKWRR